MSRPIPVRLHDKFFARMAAADNDDLPDGAWWAVLEETAQQFMEQHNLTEHWRTACDAVHQYIRNKGEQ